MADALEKPSPTAYMRFPKALYDEVLQGRFTANQLKITLAIIRYTYGHRDQVEGARISRRFISEKTGIHDRSVRSVLGGLTRQGVLVEVEPAKGRRPAKIAVQEDASKWGMHSPGAPPLRAAAGNPGRLREHQFRAGESGRGRPDKAVSSCGRGSAPPAGMDAQTGCGRGRPDSEEPEEGSLKTHDSGSLCEPPLSPCREEDQELSCEEGKRLMSDYVARHRSEEKQAMIKKALGSKR